MDVITRDKPWFVGCACDSKYVEPTAVMLASLSVNGQVPEATVIVAAFDLTPDERNTLRAGAGAAGRGLRLIDVTREMLHEVDETGYTDAYPVAVLGRLFVPYEIRASGARLLTLDSDMIVNGSVRPLFELDLGSEFFGAVHDMPRWDNPRYFNSGMTLVDVDGYLHHDIGRRCLRWLGAQPQRPRWPDQDALNTIVGDSWYRLNRTWNFTYYKEFDPFSLRYEDARIAHFTANPKPWDQDDHVGRPLYDLYRRWVRERLESGAFGIRSVARDFIPASYEIFLGRPLESDSVIRERGGWTASDIVRSIVASPEFALNALRWVREGERPPDYLFAGAPTIRQRLWAADHLELGPENRTAIEHAESWSAFLNLILRDPAFQRSYGVAPAAGSAESATTTV